MKNIRQLMFPLLISMLVIGGISCSEDKSYKVGPNTFIFEETYRGDWLDITLDGTQLHNITAEVSEKDLVVTIKITNFPKEASVITWKTRMNEDDKIYEFLGEYTLTDGKIIQYKVTFSNLLDRNKSCKIVCETLE